jgi:deoxyribodipyrimidine photo-lyase
LATRDVQEERIRHLNDENTRDGEYVLYWMQEAQRAELSHALEYAAQKANERGQRLLVAFGLTEVCRRAYERAVLLRHALS